MTPTVNSASAAYSDALKRLSDLNPNAKPDAAAGGGLAGQVSFSDMVQDVLQTTKQVSEAGETQTMRAAANQADVVDVVTAVANAEVTLQTVVSVRDRVIDAYKEIIRMPM